MKTFGLLRCSVCGEELHITGKEGAVIQTFCSDCGMSSQSMVTTHIKRVEDRKRALDNPVIVHHYPR